MKVYFVGAGPGDPELITVKGRRLLEEAGVIIYAGSLVNPEILKYAPPGAKLYNSASLTLEEVLAIMQEAVARGEKVVRLHTGDPSLYGAIQEQMDALEGLGIPYEIVPGVSSFAAAAAAVRREFTLPGISQTVILTRRAGRTPVPAGESLPDLSRHRASLCLFLSSQDLAAAAAELARGYGENTPAAVVYKASWPEEKIIHGTLGDIAARSREAGIDRTALLLVGDFLAGSYQRSLLYNPAFSHGYREAKTPHD
ncbi:MAG: precorrin-4/cobalt-precorrin-4 C11-methyltransferase [Moorella sp. (in: firmicutes)]|jgi:precorrin-4/cobalt-precorrin-4 C11-methyltransferase|uniref:precorrin-4 C(11)-methyltransferase n=1 Tax=unclassified Neomoorella TaxID=2676739 RepID=UPI0010FFC1B5|nr:MULTISPECIES: precorrin-4 C(11)-methyltransferase [unclassified Moorella (in: firmicutes)]MDK2815434.1 precorrin-4/cobalt-precorrin-4 C11-methyltransferase [Moorella sp. (in: firmicutes)]MDK2894401.1 precorrin-4/cobalt-precorrin-4 C11-methyltransferase [Moorella sp. (in: firmicutes)]GEA15296.1 precorrin-4 C(11)-methyltransferase [Moorella sp. E308F]GEA19843.1 precorrin-4 C(11)-methyltransferase [Moorella sp. E306M]